MCIYNARVANSAYADLNCVYSVSSGHSKPVLMNIIVNQCLLTEDEFT